jgi:hypothetical protein
MAERPPASDVRERRANRWLAVLSLVLATIVWYAIREAISFETVLRDVPIVVRPGEGLTVLEQSHDTADIRFRGARSDLAQLDAERTRIQVDVPAAAPSEKGARLTLKLRPAHVRSPSGAVAMRIEPDEVSFSVDREGERQVPVKAEFQDALPEGYEIGGVTCTPATVLLKGPLSKLQDVDVVRTLPIDLLGRVQSFRVRASAVPPAAFSGARVDPDRVTIEVDIVEHAAVRRLSSVPVRSLVRPGGGCEVDVQPETVHIQLQGRTASLEALDPAVVHAFVETAGLDRGAVYELPVQVYVPPGVRLLSVEPSSVRVTVRK